MSAVAVWSFVALMMVPLVLVLGLTFAPKRFWRRLAKRSRAAAHFLWGFSHWFGPLSKPGQPPAWERLR